MRLQGCGDAEAVWLQGRMQDGGGCALKRMLLRSWGCLGSSMCSLFGAKPSHSLQTAPYVSLRACEGRGARGFPATRTVGVCSGNVSCWGLSLTLSPQWGPSPGSWPILAKQAASLPFPSLPLLPVMSFLNSSVLS